MWPSFFCSLLSCGQPLTSAASSKELPSPPPRLDTLHYSAPLGTAGKLIQETLVSSFLGFCKGGSSMLSVLQAECEGLHHVSA